MRLKNIVATLSLSLICLVSRVSFADTITMTGVGGQSTDNLYVNPYIFTDQSAGGTIKQIDMSCLNFNREVSIGESWSATAINVSTISSSATIDGESGVDILADAYLYNQYAGAVGNTQLTSDIQFAIWSIMDPTDLKVVNGVPTYSGFDTNAQTLAAQALSKVTGSNALPSSYFANDEIFVPSSSYPNGGEPQIFMTDPPPSTSTPEPTSLILLGTGLLGTVVVMRRKRVNF